MPPGVAGLALGSRPDADWPPQLAWLEQAYPRELTWHLSLRKFALRPGREAQLLRRLLDTPRNAARPSLVVRIWRELIGDSLSRQGAFHISVYGGRDSGIPLFECVSNGSSSRYSRKTSPSFKASP